MRDTTGMPQEPEGMGGRFWHAWNDICDQAVLWECPYVLSIDSDVICPPNTIGLMMEYMAEDVWAVYHALPSRTEPVWVNHAPAGLALFQTELLCDAFREWEAGEHDYQYVEWMLAQIANDTYGNVHGLKHVLINELTIEHLRPDMP